MVDLPEFKIDGKAGKGLAGGIIGGLVGNVVAQGVTTRGEGKRSEIRMKESEHAAGLAERLMRLQSELRTGELSAESDIAHSHRAEGASRVKTPQFEAHYRDKDTAGAPAPVSTGASTPATGTPSIPSPSKKAGGVGEHLKDWGNVPGQLTMFDKSGRVSKGVAPKTPKTPKTPKSGGAPEQGELF